MEALRERVLDDQEYLRDDGAFVFHHPPKYLWERSPETIDRALVWQNYHLYIHVPFCRKICTFCTFERRQLHRGAIDWFTTLLDSEMDLYQSQDSFDQANIQSVYLGGGTASLLSNDNIAHILKRLRAEFGLYGEETEITLESEPGTKKPTDLQAIRKIGVNRISIGAQAFDDVQLKLLNRSHSVQQTLDMIRAAKHAGFDNLHIDVMYGLPGQSMARWQETVKRTIDLEPTHISAYPLIVFPGELLDRSLEKNALPRRPDKEVINEMREYATAEFAAAGLLRYSTAEFARTGKECRYVQSTWDSSDYLGFGPGAYSRYGHLLWEDEVIHPGYERMIQAGTKPLGKRYEMAPEQQLQRDIAMGLCLLEIDIDVLQKKAGCVFENEFLETYEHLEDQGLIDRKGARIFLTEKGVRYATYVMKCFTTQ
ncbi:radical SAM family heme chaperone HemW [Kiloniella laminariae]|uniref:Heme chaperone HemW n=1 Tax=Kiloniella laminariae TaxID=454162 RepID=A0ABT4LHH9_9PROT|nr:radical SAM family heme chaperone HemW [Kiloniella laminariae]MCZ4280555.1 radical SAM family heme chaperone HemW [Kiloniella laminariae]